MISLEDSVAHEIFLQGKLYIQTGKVKPVSKQIAANPKAEICAFGAPEEVVKF